MQDVAIFWDYENCPAPSSASGYLVANNIRLMAKPYGCVKSLKAYLAITDQFTVARAITLRSEFQASGVSLIDCPHNGRKEVADKMIIVDMLAYAIDNPAPSTIILITGDRDFAYAMSILRLRQYQVILATLPNAHSSLIAQASKCIDWYSEVLNQVEQPVARSSNTRVAGFGRAASSQDRVHSPSLTFQPRQFVQETRENDRADQGDLVQYIRSATDYRCLPDTTLLNTPAVYPPLHQNRYPEYPRQDNLSVEVELGHKRPGPSPPVPLFMVDSEDLNLPAARDEKAPTTVAESLSISPSSKIPGSPPPLKLSINQTDDAYELEDDARHNEDSTFLYPIRPASAPNSLPSPTPVAAVASYNTEPPASEVPLVADNSSQDGSSPTLPTLPNSTVQPLSDTISPQPITFSSPSVSPIISRVVAPADPVTVSTASLHTSFSAVAASPSASLVPGPSLPLLPHSIEPPAPLVVPSVFHILVQALQAQKSKGSLRPLRSIIGMSISRNGMTYKNAGVGRFGDYVSLAQRAGIIELGGMENSAWISLTPTWTDVKLH
ncbi:hypothetical protein HYPSUDRAFT_198186 [Hypholoma sublateritium FD-334 SS-4]|uniref:NYN domain-containing protein n=1 Tax=Hypholoma sublateritium (strain FD-334 SS-4) TaxID=945553 RepID=A0A0D2P8X4_HYPSF|nr:hypothetical protein HYPSUDRAFT_198186 [Hypholoma sublateritium FD-334 SS-4]